jgi:hypothetical protein
MCRKIVGNSEGNIPLVRRGVDGIIILKSSIIKQGERMRARFK